MTFESLRDQLANLEVPQGEARKLVWVVAGRLGAATTASGGYEIFLSGSPLTATSPLVARHLQHDFWEPSTGGSAFAATRVLLGAAPHFAAVAALIAIELMRIDLSTDAAIQTAFNDVEPIIELAIRRGALSTEMLLGLVAELQVLRVALLATGAPKRPATLLGWRGWTQGRDFVFGHHAIEVKATLGETSRHAFSGVHQLEAQPLPGSEYELLHLMSFGMAEVPDGGQSLPELVEDVSSLFDNGSEAGASARMQFLAMIREYGGSAATGYDHEVMHNWTVYQTRFSIIFGRLYAIDDPQMRLITSALLDQTFAIPGSVSFELQFPSNISAFNPALSWQAEINAAIAN